MSDMTTGKKSVWRMLAAASFKAVFVKVGDCLSSQGVTCEILSTN